ncbi:hypothetical protein EPIB2_381 [Tritonibacter mobilis]|nr:hypothetical protein EPIB2_381 [Tritonibacter mobilis]
MAVCDLRGRHSCLCRVQAVAVLPPIAQREYFSATRCPAS